MSRTGMSVVKRNFQRFRIGGISCWRLVPNARRIDRIIGSDWTSDFETPQSYGNDSEARKSGSVRVEGERFRFCSISTAGPMLQNRWKPTWKRWNVRSYTTLCTIQTLLLPNTLCFDRWHTAWLIRISAPMMKTKNGSIRESPQKNHRFLWKIIWFFYHSIEEGLPLIIKNNIIFAYLGLYFVDNSMNPVFEFLNWLRSISINLIFHITQKKKV